jgi:dipeptidyl aminopeptidase/acylaminoacyl peptidase
MPRRAYGSWPSPIPAELLVAGASLPGNVHADGDVVWWSQSRPDQGGRQQVVRRDPDGTVTDVLPDDFNARTRVHEYGGAAWWVHAGDVFACSWADQRLYRAAPGAAPVALTPEPPVPHGFRYADGVLGPDGATVLCVRETHDGDDVRNEVVALAADPDGEPAAPAVLATGRDFVAAPRVSPDGARLAWLTWDHPNMPWDNTELWVGDLTGSGAGTRLANPRRIAGTPGESLVQPQWGPDGLLFVVSDRSDWWNVYRVEGPDTLVAVHPVVAEISLPAWVFGQSQYVVAADGTVWMTFHDQGVRLVGVAPDGAVRDLALPDLAGLHQLRDAGPGALVAISTGFDSERAVVRLLPERAGAGTVSTETLKPGRDLGLDPAGISRPQQVSFPSRGGRTAHAWYYPPAGVLDGEPLTGEDGERPPLVTMIHGGPTAAAEPSFNLEVQFWTSRGFAVVDVDYGGSTGYGRAYRRLLDGTWGVVDVDDACAAAEHLAAQGLADGARLAITGGSAGGFTTLACLALRDTFAAGASHYGVADLSALARDTHKFESRYLDGLIGPWPQDEAVYTERSPLTHVDGFDRPLIVLQGLEDAVVPPSQAEMIVKALRDKGVPYAYLTFPGEQHGFRIAANIVRALTGELYFYSRVFGFALADDVEPVPIEFEDRLAR